MKAKNVQVHDLHLDLQKEASIAKVRKNLNEERSELLFEPEKYSKNDLELTTDK